MRSSGLGALSALSPKLRTRFDPPPTRDQLVALMQSYVADVRDGLGASNGWPSTAYSISKIALNALARILAEELRQRFALDAGDDGDA